MTEFSSLPMRGRMAVYLRASVSRTRAQSFTARASFCGKLVVDISHPDFGRPRAAGQAQIFGLPRFTAMGRCVSRKSPGRGGGLCDPANAVEGGIIYRTKISDRRPLQKERHQGCIDG